MKKVDGFVTVEYALLLPVLYVIYAFIIYVTVYQYHICLEKNDKYVCAVEEKNYSPQNILYICKELNDE